MARGLFDSSSAVPCPLVVAPRSLFLRETRNPPGGSSQAQPCCVSRGVAVRQQEGHGGEAEMHTNSAATFTR